jgi:hypothetical protein
MKRRPLPLGFIILSIAFAALFLTSAIPGDDKSVAKNDSAPDYYAMVRANQVTGTINPADYLRALNQVGQQRANRSGNAFDFDWNLLGPNNLGGKTRAILFDNRDTSGQTMFAGSVMGGIFRSDNGGGKWYQLSNGGGNMGVSCIAQAGNGDIYAGTGDGFIMKDSTVLSSWGYTTGFMGQGIFKSTDGENFTLLSSTKPYVNGNNEFEWGFINELATDPSDGAIYAATNTGLKYSSDGGNSWTYAIADDTLELNVSSKDVKMAANGLVIAEVNNLCYVSQDGNPSHFVMVSGDSTYNIPKFGIGRVEFAISLSNNDIIYALAVNTSGALLNVYRSDDKGSTWTIVGPGGSQNFNVFNTGSNINYGIGTMAATIEVFPDDPYHVLVGGKNLWEGKKIAEDGYYQWTLQTTASADWMSEVFLFEGPHTIKFVPGSTSKFFVGTNGGISLGTIQSSYIPFTFQSMNKDYIASQFYTVGWTMEKKNVLGGAQDLGTIFINGADNPGDNMRGADIWTTQSDVPDGKTGGYCAMSTIYPAAVIYSRFPHTAKNDILETFVRRNEFSGGPDWSSTMFSGNYYSNTTAFLSPFLLWENYEDYNTKDSVGANITKNYPAGSTLWIESNNGHRPFKYITPVDLYNGDSIVVPDIITARFFIGGRDQVLMTKQVIQFDVQPEWYVISDKDHGGVSDYPQCMAYSSDANHIFVGTDKGKVYRISNVKYAYNTETADVGSAYCVTSTKQIPVYLPGTTTENTQVVTSVAVDPNDANRVLITLGNYGNDYYVYLCENALDENPVFRSVMGDAANGGLPKAPAYSSLFEMNPDNNLVMVGTEFGIYATNNISANNPTWSVENNNIGSVPVFQIKQQTIRKGNDTIYFYNIDTTYVVHYGVNNYGVIYGATFGRGLISLDEFQKPLGITDPGKPVASQGFSIYPNPATDRVTVAFELKNPEPVEISIFDLQGKQVKNVNLGVRPEGRSDAILNCSNLGSGTYVMRLNVGSRQLTSKFIVQ